MEINVVPWTCLQPENLDTDKWKFHYLAINLLWIDVLCYKFITFYAKIGSLVTYVTCIREYGSTLYVGLARAVSPTNTNFRLTFLLTRLQEALYEDLAV